MRRNVPVRVLMVAVGLVLSAACAAAPGATPTPSPISSPAATRPGQEPSEVATLNPGPPDTADLSAQLPSSTPTAPPAAPTATPTATGRAEPTMAGTLSGQPPTEPPTEVPTATFTPAPSTEAPARVADARVIYHNGFSQDGIGVYERGAFPWLDLLVRIGGTWYGPERAPDDGIQAVPLPEGFRWEAEGAFGVLPNGEAWWAESGTVGTARLVDASAEVLVELPLRITFRGPGGGGGDGDPGLPPTPT